MSLKVKRRPSEPPDLIPTSKLPSCLRTFFQCRPSCSGSNYQSLTQGPSYVGRYSYKFLDILVTAVYQLNFYKREDTTLGRGDDPVVVIYV